MKETAEDRRRFLIGLLAGGCTACLTGAFGLRTVMAQDAALGASLVESESGELPLFPARWWKELEGGRIECGLCPRKCRVADLERGACGVRENRSGKYYTLSTPAPARCTWIR